MPNLGYLTLRKFADVKQATLLASLVILPFFLHWATGGRIYVPFEAAGFFLVAFLYQPPPHRSRNGALAIGATFGLMQWFKFGGGIIIGGAHLIVDLMIVVTQKGSIKHRLTELLRANVWILAGFLIMETLRGATWLILLPPADAMDVIWPSFHLQAYTAFDQEGQLPRFESWHLLLGKQLPGVVMIVTSLIVAFLLGSNNKAIRRTDVTFTLAGGMILLLFTSLV